MADTQFHTENNDVVLNRRFDAPRALVFQAWTDPQMMAAWFGPGEFTASATADARQGGRFTITMHGPDGTDYPIDGEFAEFVRDEHLVMTMSADRHPPEWHAMIRKAYIETGGDPETYASGPIRTRVDFSDSGDGTLVTVRQTFPSGALRDAHATLGNPTGWSQSFDKLDTVLAGR